MSTSTLCYVAFLGTCLIVLKELNTVVVTPYMDEPFHVPQAQAYCKGEYTTWDPKITTPPGLYVLSTLMYKAFVFKCNLAILRLTPLLTLLVLPFVLTRLLCYHKRIRPPPILQPSAEAVILSTFPIVWFFGFLYYTDVPSVLGVVASVVAASQGNHWSAALLGLISCTFRQTNIVWLLYGYASSQLMYLRFRRSPHGGANLAKLHDPPALEATFSDLVRALLSAPKVLLDILPAFVPYSLVLGLFGLFIVWNGGIVLGDKSNHIPAFHVPQLYYFVAFSTLLGWPILISGQGGIRRLIHDVYARMFGTARQSLVTILLMAAMATSVHFYTIHHPFLLSDNRHYTFYVWRRIFMLHPVMPYLLVPGYLACTWAWFLRVGSDQTILQVLILPVCVLPTLLPTPLLEPRYFLIPYILLRAQVADVSSWGVVMEGLWYGCINAVTMWVFLYHERAGVGRFMW